MSEARESPQQHCKALTRQAGMTRAAMLHHSSQLELASCEMWGAVAHEWQIESTICTRGIIGLPSGFCIQLFHMRLPTLGSRADYRLFSETRMLMFSCCCSLIKAKDATCQSLFQIIDGTAHDADSLNHLHHRNFFFLMTQVTNIFLIFYKSAASCEVELWHQKSLQDLVAEITGQLRLVAGVSTVPAMWALVAWAHPWHVLWSVCCLVHNAAFVTQVMGRRHDSTLVHIFFHANLSAASVD